MAALESEIELLASLKKTKIPDTLHRGLVYWIREGLQPGHFLTAVITNDLLGAVNYGDRQSCLALVELVQWLKGNAPCGCWGSERVIESWKECCPRK